MSTSRFTIDLDTTFNQKLTALAERKQTTKAEIIKRALATYSYISGQASPESENKLSITDKEDRVIKDIVIP